MTNREKANQIVTEAIQAQNMMLSEDMQISLDPSTHLTGDSGVLDSLGFVTFIVNLEEQASTLFSIDISVSDAAVMDDMDKYFETIGNLTEYITNLIDKVS